MPNVGLANRLANRIGKSATRRFPDVVTFQRFTTAKSPAGGNLPAIASNNTPANVPVRYWPASGDESVAQGKPLSANSYVLAVPAYFSSALVDVDAKSTAVVAARAGGEPSRTFQVQSIGRYEGLEIELLATLEG